MSKSKMVEVLSVMGTVCGIEVSARSLLVALRRNDQDQPLREFPNTPAGHQALLRFLERAAHPVRVCLESTGRYGLDLALTLHQAGLPVMVANPRAVRHFAQALLQRSKNDQLDAGVLREFAARMPFLPWHPPSPTALKLIAAARRIAALTQMRTMEKNRLHAASVARALPAFLRLDLRRSIRVHDQAIERLARAAQEFILNDSALQRRYQLLLSIPGLGPASAVQVLAELSLLSPDLDVRQWVASAGLDPREQSSGTSLRKKTVISKAGNAHLRRALFMPALVAVQHEPHFRAFYEHLLKLGKAKMQALIAVMRKLLHAIFGMFKHHQPFDGSKVYALNLPLPEVA